MNKLLTLLLAIPIMTQAAADTPSQLSFGSTRPAPQGSTTQGQAHQPTLLPHKSVKIKPAALGSSNQALVLTSMSDLASGNVAVLASIPNSVVTSGVIE